MPVSVLVQDISEKDEEKEYRLLGYTHYTHRSPSRPSCLWSYAVRKCSGGLTSEVRMSAPLSISTLASCAWA